jgi:hypothetical protein
VDIGEAEAAPAEALPEGGAAEAEGPKGPTVVKKPRSRTRTAKKPEDGAVEGAEA